MEVSRTLIEKRIRFKESALEKLYDAYLSLVEGKVKAYTIDDRQLTRLDLTGLAEEIKQMESELDELNDLLAGTKPRKAFGIVPRDW